MIAMIMKRVGMMIRINRMMRGVDFAKSQIVVDISLQPQATLLHPNKVRQIASP